MLFRNSTLDHFFLLNSLRKQKLIYEEPSPYIVDITSFSINLQRIKHRSKYFEALSANEITNRQKELIRFYFISLWRTWGVSQKIMLCWWFSLNWKIKMNNLKQRLIDKQWVTQPINFVSILFDLWTLVSMEWWLEKSKNIFFSCDWFLNLWNAMREV